MLDMDLLEASRCRANYFLRRLGTILVAYGKVKESRFVDSGIPQGLLISPLLSLVCTSFPYNNIRKSGAHSVGSIGDISTIYKDGRYIDKDTATLNSSITDLP